MRPCSSEAQQPCLGIVGSSPFCRWSTKKSSDWRQRLDWHDGTAHEFCSNIWVWVNIADPMTKDQSLCFPSHYPKKKRSMLIHIHIWIIYDLWSSAIFYKAEIGRSSFEPGRLRISGRHLSRMQLCATCRNSAPNNLFPEKRTGNHWSIPSL